MAATANRSGEFPGPVALSLTNSNTRGNVVSAREAVTVNDPRKKKRPAPKPGRPGVGNMAVASSSRPRTNSSGHMDLNRNPVATSSRHTPSGSRENVAAPDVGNRRQRTRSLNDSLENIDSQPTGVHSSSRNNASSRESINSTGAGPQAGNRRTSTSPGSGGSSTQQTLDRANQGASVPEVSISQNWESGAATVTINDAASTSTTVPTTTTTDTNSSPTSNVVTTTSSSQNICSSTTTTTPPLTATTNLPMIFRPVNSTRPEHSNPHRWSTSSDHAVGVDDQRRLLSSSNSLDILREPTGNVQQMPVQARFPAHENRHSRPVSTTDILPDILNSHVPPPYERRRQRRQPRGDRPSSPRRSHRNDRHRHSRGNRSRSRRHHRRRHTSSRSSQTNLQLDEDKQCCSGPCCRGCLETVTKFRWVLVTLALLGLCCIVTGIILGALHAAGPSFLMLSLMFVGLGILLVIVVVVGWRCTPSDHEPCHLLFGLGMFASEPSPDLERGFPERRERTPHWFGGVLYPEFRYRRPPPSYNASMHDYQQQIMMAAQLGPGDQAGEGEGLPNSPPPTYRSQASVRPGLHITFPTSDEYPSSRPPTYRSHAGTLGHGTHARPALVIDNAQTTSDATTDNQTDSNATQTLNVEDSNTTANTQTNMTTTTQSVTDSQAAAVSTVSVTMTDTVAASSQNATVTPSIASNDHVVRLTLSENNNESTVTSQTETSTDNAQNGGEVIGENTMHRGFRLVESLETMLDESLRSMDESEAADNVANNDMTSL